MGHRVPNAPITNDHVPLHLDDHRVPAATPAHPYVHAQCLGLCATAAARSYAYINTVQPTRPPCMQASPSNLANTPINAYP